MPLVDESGYLKFNKEHNAFEWKIKNYKRIAKKKVIKSPILYVNTDNRKKFQLQFHISEVIHPFSFMSSNFLFLCTEQTNEELTCKYEISIMKNTQICETATGHHIFSKNYEMKKIFEISADYFRDYISSKGSVIFYCELTVAAEERLNIDKVLVPSLKFDWVFLDENLSDIKLKTASGQEIPAHKVVLAAASPVFRAMFTLDMLERKSQSVNMIDISYEAAVEMLRFVYTSSIENSKFPLSVELLIAGDKYQLEGLKNRCEKILSTELSAENAVDILKVADKCNMSRLKKNAVDFIKRYMSVSSDSDDVSNLILSMERLFSK